MHSAEEKSDNVYVFSIVYSTPGLSISMFQLCQRIRTETEIIYNSTSTSYIKLDLIEPILCEESCSKPHLLHAENVV